MTEKASANFSTLAINFIIKTKMTKSASRSRVFNLVIVGRNDRVLPRLRAGLSVALTVHRTVIHYHFPFEPCFIIKAAYPNGYTAFMVEVSQPQLNTIVKVP